MPELRLFGEFVAAYMWLVENGPHLLITLVSALAAWVLIRRLKRGRK